MKSYAVKFIDAVALAAKYGPSYVREFLTEDGQRGQQDEQEQAER